jgi:pyruvate/2-oxoglutarate dehydrogenase complex dihydrolipoamide acyltransferase (E2) component
MPQMGTSIAEGTIIGWTKQPGDAVEVDETLCEVSTDKIDTECPSPVAGVLDAILVEVGATVDVGTVIARIATGATEAPGPGTELDNAEPSPTALGADARAGDRSDPRRPDSDRRYSPVVQRMAAAHDLDLAQVKGTGRAGRVTKRDVLAHLEEGPVAAPEERPLHSESPYKPDLEPAPRPAAQPSTSAERASPPSQAASAPTTPALDAMPAELSRMRQSIGTAMRRSLDTAATCHTAIECDLTLVEERRREAGLTALPLIARAVLDVLPSFPDLNATLDGSHITRHRAIQLGIAVSLGDEGLIVPVIRDAQDLSPEGLSKRIKDVAKRAHARRLSPDEVRGGTFTITSPGAYGALWATPIINLPQVGILDVEAVVRRPVVVTSPDGGESIAIRSMVNLILGWDHRAMDGVYAARFLAQLRDTLEGRSHRLVGRGG